MEMYIVMGTTGEYSDRSEWSVCCYTDRALADKHADEAMRFAVAAHTRAGKYSDYDNPASPWDADMLCDYTGTDYYVLTVPMRSVLPVAP